MTIRLFGALLCGAALVLVTSTGSYAKSTKKQGTTGPAKTTFSTVFQQVESLRAPQSGKGGTARATTVKSSKSNTSDRMGGGGGKSYDNENPRPTSRGTTHGGPGPRFHGGGSGK
jgi:hypothetical protein